MNKSSSILPVQHIQCGQNAKVKKTSMYVCDIVI